LAGGNTLDFFDAGHLSSGMTITKDAGLQFKATCDRRPIR
jgi:hypothetical protein